MSFKIHIHPGKRILSAEKGDNLAKLLSITDSLFSQPCGGMGLCGKCSVEITDGPLPEPQDIETSFLSPEKLKNGYRLACLYRIEGDVSIRIPDESLAGEIDLLQIGLVFKMPIDPAVKKFPLFFPPGKEDGPGSLETLFNERLQTKGIRIPPDIKAGSLLKEYRGYSTAVIYEGTRLITLESPDTLDMNFGLAVDIGTTTVSAELVDLTSGYVLGIESILNRQIKYGSDVISRISFAISNPDQAELLQREIQATLDDIVSSLLKKTKVNPSFIYEIVISGNTVMNHLFLGIPVDTLAVAPFHEVFTRLPSFPAEKLDIHLNDHARVYFAPNIHSFIGGDISSGLTASDFMQAEGNLLYIDLGTNGEIVLKKDDIFKATSAAAGPAFEGMNISCGMPAFPGAVYKLENREGLHATTISNRKPKGICGTGLIDITARSLKNGMISSKGVITHPSKKIPVTGKLHLIQKDIREIQLATAAIKTAIKMLLKDNDLKPNELNGIFIAGAFGNYLNIRNTMRIGLLPSIPEDRVTFIGNASLAGARALLLSREARAKTETAIDSIEFLSLASDQAFQKMFVESLDFKT